MANILVIDDEISIKKAITLFLKDDGHQVDEAESRPEAIKLINSNLYDIIISDLYVPTENDGIRILLESRKRLAKCLFIIITAHGSVDCAVEAIKQGADDFIAKGFTMEELKFRLQKLIEQQRIKKENLILAENNSRLQKEVESNFHYKNIVGKSKAINNLMELLDRVITDRNSTVLLQGESGTGKELIARAIHYNGPRKDKPFVPINCAALPEQLLESELFGYEKGTFTGASKDRAGKFEIANGGTIFIDEVGELNSKVQVELLRFLQDHTFERIGSNCPITVDVRIIAATNKLLSEQVAAGHFREDLFYRLNVIPVQIPPLRERKEDIPLLVNHFLQKYGAAKNKELRFAKEAFARLDKYNWPGNVRELENLVERLTVISSGETILPSDLPSEILNLHEKEIFESALGLNSLKDACTEFEKTYLLQILEKYHWNITEAAKAIGERRDTLSKKISRYKLKKNE